MKLQHPHPRKRNVSSYIYNNSNSKLFYSYIATPTCTTMHTSFFSSTSSSSSSSIRCIIFAYKHNNIYIRVLFCLRIEELSLSLTLAVRISDMSDLRSSSRALISRNLQRRIYTYIYTHGARGPRSYIEKIPAL